MLWFIFTEWNQNRAWRIKSNDSFCLFALSETKKKCNKSPWIIFAYQLMRLQSVNCENSLFSLSLLNEFTSTHSNALPTICDLKTKQSRIWLEKWHFETDSILRCRLQNRNDKKQGETEPEQRQKLHELDHSHTRSHFQCSLLRRHSNRMHT